MQCHNLDAWLSFPHFTHPIGKVPFILSAISFRLSILFFVFVGCVCGFAFVCELGIAEDEFERTKEESSIGFGGR